MALDEPLKLGSQQLVRTKREQLAVTSPSGTHERFLLPSRQTLCGASAGSISSNCSFAHLARKRARAPKNPDGVKAIEAGAPTVCMHAVSGSISLPSRGSFRLSLTVLVHYRSITSI